MTSDHFAVRVVVVTVAVCTTVGLAAIAYLSFTGTAIPDQLDRIVTLLAGALIGILAKTSTSSSPQAVSVVNPPGDPVQVEEAEAEPARPLRAR